MLLFQDKETQDKCKEKLLNDIAKLIKSWKGPYICGD